MVVLRQFSKMSIERTIHPTLSPSTQQVYIPRFRGNISYYTAMNGISLKRPYTERRYKV